MSISRCQWLAFAALLLVAFALRAHGLDRRALWWDEGLTLLFARLSFAENADYAVRLADTNPPYYRLLVGAWGAAAGSSAFATRLFSVLAGMVMVAGAARLGRACRGAGLGLAAGALAATSPMLIYFAQEAKVYSLVAACGTAACLLCLRLIRRPGGRGSWAAWVGYGLALAVALGSHYITIFLIGVQAAWLALAFWRRRAPAARQPGPTRTGLVTLAATLAVVALAQLPYWGLTYAGTSAVLRGETGAFEGLHGPAEFFGAHLLEFGVGPGSQSEGERGNGDIEGVTGTRGTEGTIAAGHATSPATIVFWAAALALAALALAGVFLPTNSANEFPQFPKFLSISPFPLFLLSLLLLPLLAGFLLNAYHEFFFPRFLLYSVPPYLVLAGAGWLNLWRRGRLWRAVAAGALAMAAFAWATYLAAFYSVRGDEAEDWRPLAAVMQSHTRPGDAAVYGRGWMPGYLHAYLPPAPEPDYYLAHFTPESLAPELEALAAAHPRLWLLDYQIDQFDPRNPAGLWLGQHGALVYAEWFGHGHAALFMPAAHLPDPAAGAQRTDFANGLQLGWSPISVVVSPGEAVALGLDWTAPPAAPPARFTVFLHGLAADGSLAFGRDSEPVNGLRPADGWLPGETVREWRGALLPPGLPPGDYTLQVGLYDTLTGNAIPLKDGAAALTVGRVTVR